MMIAEALANVPQFGMTVALQSSGEPGKDGLHLCAEAGGPDEERQEFVLTGRAPIGPWESWRLKRGAI
jgi:hypothetical protein